MREFDEFVKQVGKSARLDPWVRERGFAGYVQELKKEADEVIEAIGNNDRENIREELGDVLYDWLHACALAGIPLRDIIASAAEKLQRRKPYLRENRSVSSEEAVAIWKRVKEEEHARR
ncbi:hypothetical protein J4439_02465 [Candidatus Woesearchaeota archaeon]|nr:hypothetical protein [Candidatus Woesearchaeota archaeon]